MQDKPHRRLNLTQPYGQANGATLTAPENGVGDSHEPEAPPLLSVTDAVEPLRKSGESRPAYLVVPLDSANEALVSALQNPATSPAPTAASTVPVASANSITKRWGWLMPAVGGMTIGALVVGAVAFRGNAPQAAAPRAVSRRASATPTSPPAAKPVGPVTHTVVRADGAGALTLTAAGATPHGTGIRQAPDAIGYWDNTNAYVTWAVETARAGKYRVALTHAVGTNCGGPFVVQASGSRIVARSRSTGGWIAYHTTSLGTVTLPKGSTTVTVRPNGKLATALMNLRTLHLTPAPTGRSRRSGRRA